MIKPHPPATRRRKRITSRDMEILRTIFRFEFLSTQQARDEFWGGKDNCNHSKRLRMLCERGLLELLEVSRSTDPAYRLTPLGCTTLKDAGLVSADEVYRRKNYGSLYEHNKTLGSLLRCIEKQPLVHHIEIENDLLKRYHDKIKTFTVLGRSFKIPDGRITLHSNRGTLDLALELELTIKSRPMYRKIFADYQKASDWSCLLYVVRDDHQLRRLVALFQELVKEPGAAQALFNETRIYIATLPALTSDFENALLVGFADTTTLLRLAQLGIGKQPNPLPLPAA